MEDVNLVDHLILSFKGYMYVKRKDGLNLFLVETLHKKVLKIWNAISPLKNKTLITTTRNGTS